MDVPNGVHIIETNTGDKNLFLTILELEDGLLLIDTGEKRHPQEAILPFMESIGRSPEQIRLIVNSHADVDHFGGNHAMRMAAPGALFACHNLDRRWIASRERTMAEHYNRFAREHGVFYDEDIQDWLSGAMGPDVPVALGLSGGERFELAGGRDLLVLHTPGHTPGHLSFWDESTRTAIIADAILGEAVPDASGQPQSPPPYYTPQSYLSSIQTLESLAPQHLLTCHYPAMHGEAVGEFLAQSRAWVTSCDQALRDALQEAESPLRLSELIDLLDGRLGPYPFKLAFKYTIAGHADQLVSLGLAERLRVDGLVAWQWLGE
jgi:glyoxylase-like metal-dependent hydrolase (beta-lactamase superfamily II)